MKKIYVFFLSVILILTFLLSATGCESIFNMLISELESSFVSDQTDPSDNTDIGIDEKPTETIKKTSIPFSKAPEIPEYELPKEEYVDDIEKEASELVDEFIAKAISYVNVMKDDRQSKKVFGFEPDANGYLSKLSKEERQLFDRFISYAKQGKTFTIKAEDFKGDLKKAYFAFHSPMTLCEPGIASFTDFDVKSTVSFETFESTYHSISSYFFDPHRDQNFKVDENEVTSGRVVHDAELLDRVIKRVARFMPDGLSAYDRYYYLAAFLSERVDYDDRNRNCYTAFGALIDGKSVCEGYTTAFYLLCREADLWCGYRFGHPDGVGHIWNMIKLESGIYNVDVTWADGAASPNRYRWYEYFVRSDDSFVDDGHNVSEGVEGTGIKELNPYEVNWIG